MLTLRDKINQRMDLLQAMMERNQHIDDPDSVTEHIHTVSKFWTALSDGDKDYIECARCAIEEQRRWNV